MVHRIEQTSTILLKPIQVSPRGFKRQIETVLGALVQLRMRATVFAKLPKGISWSADLKQYSQAIHPQPDVFLWVRDQHDVPDWAQPILIAKAHPMQGEYFLLAISDSVNCHLHGQREETIAPVGEDEDASKTTNPEDREPLPVVNYRITFQKPLIQNFVNELQRSVQSSWAEYPEQAFFGNLARKLGRSPAGSRAMPFGVGRCGAPAGGDASRTVAAAGSGLSASSDDGFEPLHPK